MFMETRISLLSGNVTAFLNHLKLVHTCRCSVSDVCQVYFCFSRPETWYLL